MLFLLENFLKYHAGVVSNKRCANRAVYKNHRAVFWVVYQCLIDEPVALLLVWLLHLQLLAKINFLNFLILPICCTSTLVNFCWIFEIVLPMGRESKALLNMII